jgi:hypothetical protein
LRDKAQITDGLQKQNECCDARNVILSNLNNPEIVKQSFETMAVLCNEGDRIYELGDRVYDLKDDLNYLLTGLEREHPELKKFIDQTRKDTRTIEDYADREFYKDDDINQAWQQHKIDELKAKKKAKTMTELEIKGYVESREDRKPTTLDFVVKNLKKKSNAGKE